jgi:hypothetical protein
LQYFIPVKTNQKNNGEGTRKGCKFFQENVKNSFYFFLGNGNVETEDLQILFMHAKLDGMKSCLFIVIIFSLLEMEKEWRSWTFRWRSFFWILGNCAIGSFGDRSNLIF